MKFGQKFVSLVGLFALIFGMTAGMAAADSSSSSMELGLNVQCLDRMDVAISGSGTFTTGLDEGNDPLERMVTTNPGAIKVQVNVGCYQGPWTVNADVTAFRNGSDWFDGSRLNLDAHRVYSVYNGNGEQVPFGPGDPLAPIAHDADFSGGGSHSGSENDIFHTRLIERRGPDTVQRAPWTSTALYTGQLDLSQLNLKEGSYTSTLTVELVLEDSGH
jgi:hypothetical protein